MIPSPDPSESSPPTAARVTRQTISAEYSFSGPLPHPRLLQQYDDISPGMANRLVQMAEAEAANRREMQNKIV